MKQLKVYQFVNIFFSNFLPYFKYDLLHDFISDDVQLNMCINLKVFFIQIMWY